MSEISHFQRIEKLSEELNCKKSEIIDLSSNINFVKPNTNIDFNAIDISNYPDMNNLYSSIQRCYQINKNQFELFNSEESAILSLFSSLNLKHCTIYSPTSKIYKKVAITYNYEYDLINTFTQMNRAVRENSLVVFANPSLLDGKYNEIELYLKAWSKLNCTVLIDESILDFTNYDSVIKYISQYDNIYILKSMTKFYSFEGVKCVTLISSEKNIKKIKEKEAIFRLSAYDSKYLQEVLKDEVFLKTAKAINIYNYILLENILKKSKHIANIYRSDVNFILVKLNNIKADSFEIEMNKHKILIKNCSNYDFMDDSFIRISVKNEKSIQEFEKALNNIK